MATFLTRGDRIDVRLSADERRVLGQIPPLLEMVESDPEGDAHAVLHRGAYRDDPEASRTFEELVAGELAASRRIDRDVVTSLADGSETLSRLEGLSLLRSMNEARLVLAAQGGVFEEGSGWERRIDDDPARALIAWMAHLQVQVMKAIARLEGDS